MKSDGLAVACLLHSTVVRKWMSVCNISLIAFFEIDFTDNEEQHLRALLAMHSRQMQQVSIKSSQIVTTSAMAFSAQQPK